MSANKMINSRKFMAMLMEKKDSPYEVDQGLTVQGDVEIDHKLCPIGAIQFQGITFLGNVKVASFPKECSFNFQSCHFTDGLALEDSKVPSVIIHNCTADWIHMYHCTCERAYLNSLEITLDLDISGLELTEFLKINEIKARGVVISHSSDHMNIKVPFVKTDDPLIALQFRMAGIPVFMSSQAVGELAERYGAQVAALAS